MEKLQVSATYIVHVKKGYEERAEHIKQQMLAHNINFSFVLDGDMSDLTEQRLITYFSGRMNRVAPETSCALKHLLAYEALVASNANDALIFEDDIFLTKDFNAVFNICMTEINTNKNINPGKIFISFENSGLKFISSSVANSQQKLYKQEEGRCAGAYYITKSSAKTMLQRAIEQKIEKPIDAWHNDLFKEELLDIYWCHPPIAEQGSHSGQFSSALSHRKKNITRWIIWGIRKKIQAKRFHLR